MFHGNSPYSPKWVGSVENWGRGSGDKASWVLLAVCHCEVTTLPMHIAYLMFGNGRQRCNLNGKWSSYQQVLRAFRVHAMCAKIKGTATKLKLETWIRGR
jgi:hypothetical protein